MRSPQGTSGVPTRPAGAARYGVGSYCRWHLYTQSGAVPPRPSVRNVRKTSPSTGPPVHATGTIAGHTASTRRGSRGGCHDRIICVGEILKNAVRLTFPKGAEMKDPGNLFKTRLDSKTVRAIDIDKHEPVNEAALRALILGAVRLNKSRVRTR